MPSNWPAPEECKDQGLLYHEQAVATNDGYLESLYTVGIGVSSPLYVPSSANTNTAASGTRARYPYGPQGTIAREVYSSLVHG